MELRDQAPVWSISEPWRTLGCVEEARHEVETHLRPVERGSRAPTSSPDGAPGDNPDGQQELNPEGLHFRVRATGAVGFSGGKVAGPADLEGVASDFIAPLGPWGRLDRAPFHDSGLAV